MFVIAGVTGRTGRAAAEILLSQRERVRVLVRKERDAEPWRQRGADAAIASLEDRPALEAALDGARGVFVLVPEDPSRADFRAHRRRIVESIAEAVTAKSVPHVVLLSALAAALPDGNGPAAELHHAERALAIAAPKLTTLRATYFADNVAASIGPAIAQGIFPTLLPADAPIPMIATADIGRTIARCLVEPPPASEVIDLLGPAMSMREVAGKLGAMLAKTLTVVEPPPAAHADVLETAGMARPFAEAVAELLACLRSGRVPAAGTRTIFGTTTIDELLPELLRAQRR